MNTLTRIAAALALTSATIAAPAAMAAPVKNIVLVHGFFADGSGWQGVADILTRDGFNVAVVQQPETSLAEDVKATNSIVNALDGDSKITEINGSHATFIVHPAEVAKVIEQAANATGSN